MIADAIAERSFTVDGHEVKCRFFRPEADSGPFFCRYEIAWTEGVEARKVYGVDEVQALLLAMQTAHVDLLTARENDGRDVAWLDQRSLGLPVSEAIRNWDPDGKF